MNSLVLIEFKVTLKNMSTSGQKILEHFGRNPIIIYTEELPQDQYQKLIEDLEKVRVQLNLNPNFPYPIYVVSPYPMNTFNFTKLHDRKDLPKHFKVKRKEPTVKEAPLLQKINLKRSKLSNENIELSIKEVKEHSLKHKKFYRLVRETSFYEKVLSKLN